jgi:hypothetical protein
MSQAQKSLHTAQSLKNFVTNLVRLHLMTRFKILMTINSNKLMELLFMLCQGKNICLNFNFKLLMGLGSLEVFNFISII